MTGANCFIGRDALVSSGHYCQTTTSEWNLHVVLVEEIDSERRDFGITEIFIVAQLSRP
jgi:hypothetical protein